MSVKVPDLVHKGLHTSWDGGLSLHRGRGEATRLQVPRQQGTSCTPQGPPEAAPLTLSHSRKPLVVFMPGIQMQKNQE